MMRRHRRRRLPRGHGRDAARRPHRRSRPHRADGLPTARRRLARGPASGHGAGWRRATRRPARLSVRPAPARAAGAAARGRSRPAASGRPTVCAPRPCARSARSISCSAACARCARLAPADAVQRGVIEQIVHDGDVEIERARLEHHAQQAQRLARLARHAMAEHVDRSVLRVVEPRDQREQRGLAGAVQAEQRGEARLRHGQADVLQCLRAIHRRG